MSDFEQYYIHRKGDFVGNAPMWWAKGGNGYTSYILGAERFSKEDADALIRRSGDKYKAYLCADVDARLHLVYDVQDDKRLGTDEPCGWSWGYAAIASMHGEAVAWVSEASLQTLEAGRDAIAGDKNGLRVHPLFTHAPAYSARIAEQDARIKELEQQLEVVRKDADRYQEALKDIKVARTALQTAVYTPNLTLQDMNFLTKHAFNSLEKYKSIDAAIRQIGGAE